MREIMDGGPHVPELAREHLASALRRAAAPRWRATWTEGVFRPGDPMHVLINVGGLTLYYFLMRAAARAGLGSRSARARRRSPSAPPRCAIVCCTGWRARRPGGDRRRDIPSTALAVRRSRSPAHRPSPQPTRSSPLAVAPDGARLRRRTRTRTPSRRLEFDAMHAGTLTHEAAGRHVSAHARRSRAPTCSRADQSSDTVSRLDQADLGDLQQVNLGFGCDPVRRRADARRRPRRRLLPGDERGRPPRRRSRRGGARQAALAATRAPSRSPATARRAYVTHYLTEEPSHDAHVSVVDLANKSVAQRVRDPGRHDHLRDAELGAGRLQPALRDRAHARRRARRGRGPALGRRHAGEQSQQGALQARAPASRTSPGRRCSRSSVRAVPRRRRRAATSTRRRSTTSRASASTRSTARQRRTWSARSTSTRRTTRTDIEFSPDGRVAYVVDLMFNSYHVFNTREGQDGETRRRSSPAVVATAPAARSPTSACVAGGAALGDAARRPFRMAPQAQITPIDGYDPVDPSVHAGEHRRRLRRRHVHGDRASSQMRGVPDGDRHGADRRARSRPTARRCTSPTTWRATSCRWPPRRAARRRRQAGQPPLHEQLDAARAAPTTTAQRGAGFCNHPGGAPARTDADCGTTPPCIRIAGLRAAPPRAAGVDASRAASPPTRCPPRILDGKILFNTAARDASVPNDVGLGAAAPLFNDAARDAQQDHRAAWSARRTTRRTSPAPRATPTSAARTGGRGTSRSSAPRCATRWTCAAGRASRRARAATTPATECFFDAACGDGHAYLQDEPAR